MRLIDGLQSPDQRVKALQMLQNGESSKLGSCVDFIRQLEQISSFSLQNNIDSEELLSVNYIDKNKEKPNECKYCGLQHLPRKYPAFGKNCQKCVKLNHFKNVSKSSIKYERKVDEIEKDDASVYSIIMNDSNSETNVKINDCNIKMQVDTGSQVTIIPRNFWELMSKPNLQKFYLCVKQFDGTIIKVLGEFEAKLETKSKINIVRIIVADCTKNHGLIGIIKINATNLVNNVEPIVQGQLVNYNANILIKCGIQPSYFKSQPLPINIRPLVIEKLNEMIQQGLLQRVPPGGSKWASPLVVRKQDGDLCICADYKIEVNQKICSDSYPIPNIENVFLKMAGMKYFAKIDLNGVYHQIEMDKEAQEITIVNTPIGLLRWTCLPFGIKTASAIFQRAIESVVGDIIPKMIIF